jgi:Flp pilus assembly protein TadB
MDTSPEAGSGRKSPQLKLGWIALVVFVVGIGVSFLSLPIGFALVGVGAVVLIVSMVMELRVRRAVARSDDSVFPEGGTFGGRRSPQTHSKM